MTPRLTAALLDPARADRTMAWLLVAFTIAWTLYGVVSHAGVDVHVDVGELLIWGDEPDLRWKHPPLGGWIALVWFRVLPFGDWTAQILAATTSSLALWFSWKVAGDWLAPEKRVAAVLMLTLVPLYTFHALVFNANTAQMPLWALASWFALRWLRSGRIVPAVLTGISAGAAVLSKLWGLFLVAGIGIAWLSLPDRARRLRSLGPWVAMVVFCATLAPYGLWVFAYPDRAALTLHDIARAPSVTRSLTYLAGACAYIIVPLVVFVALRPSAAALRDTFLPPQRERRLPVWLLCAPLALPAIANVLTPVRLTSLWTIPNWTVLPVVLLGSPLLTVSIVDVRRLLLASVAVTAGAVAVAPIVAFVQHRAGGAGDAAHFRQVSDAVRNVCGPAPLSASPRFGGTSLLVPGVTPYLRGWRVLGISPERVAAAQAETIAVACASGDRLCLAAAARWMEKRQATVATVAFSRRVLGYASAPRQYSVWCAPPKTPQVR